MILSRRVLWLVLWQTIILAIPGVSRLHKRAKTGKLNNWKTAKLKPIEGKLIKSVQQAGANICVACVFLSASCYVSSQKLCVLANKRISTEKCYLNAFPGNWRPLGIAYGLKARGYTQVYRSEQSPAGRSHHSLTHSLGGNAIT